MSLSLLRPRPITEEGHEGTMKGMPALTQDLIRLSACDAVAALRRGEVTPLDLIDAAAARIAAVEPAVNALPTLCLDRARDHARRLMAGALPVTPQAPGWLAGLPVVIKDLMDVAGVRTTYGSPLFRDHVPTASHPLVQRIERLGGIVIGKSNTPEFGAGGNTFNTVFGRTLNPWNTALTCGGSTGGGAVAVATGEAWLAQGSDHGGSLRGPATLCSVVGIRPSPGRVTRGTSSNLFSPLSVQGPMARSVRDLALFLDTMAGACPHDPMTFDAPRPQLPRRRDRGTATAPASPSPRISTAACRSIARPARSAPARCAGSSRPAASSRKRASISARSRTSSSPCARSNSSSIASSRSPPIATSSSPTSSGTPSAAWRRPPAVWPGPSASAPPCFRRAAAFFETYDILVTPGAATPAWDVALRSRDIVDGVRLDNYIAGGALTFAITLTSCPAVAVPCGFDRYDRPVGLQIVAPARGEAAALAAARVFEQLAGMDHLLPIDPRPGEVPP